MAEGKNTLGASFIDNFSCKICLEILHDPVQCEDNEHYFCRKCITKHLHDNTETCPLCADQLTLETLRSVPRVILDVVSQLRKPRCRYVSRGCTENVTVEELLLHEQMCGHAPIVCSNEGCKEMVNRRDKESHETEECKFRKITCESCAEEMSYHDYEKHQCTLRKEMNEMKLRLDEVTETLNKMAATQNEFLGKFKAYDENIKNLQDPLRHASSSIVQREGTVVVNGQIFIFGGYGDFRDYSKEDVSKSVEVFNWSTKTWTLIKDCLFFPRFNSFSFLYEKKMMVCGGLSTERIEYLKPSESGYCAFTSSISLPSYSKFNGLPYKNRILTFGKGVVETSMESPIEARTLLKEEYDRSSARVQRIGNNIYIVGASTSSMEVYDIVKNEFKTLPSLPYTASNMAVVAYKDNIVVLGGYNQSTSLNYVVMFNVTTHEYKRLPSMLHARYNCSAVVIGDVIVVIGGSSDFPPVLNLVEYYVIGNNTWQDLPAMNKARYCATACVYV